MQIRTPLKKILALALCLALTTSLLSGAALAVNPSPPAMRASR